MAVQPKADTSRSLIPAANHPRAVIIISEMISDTVKIGVVAEMNFARTNS